MKPCCLFKNSREIQWAVFRTYYLVIDIYKGFPWWLRGKESTCNTRATGDAGSIPGWDRSPRVGHGNLLQNSCQENPKDRGAWQATVHRVAKSRTGLIQLSLLACSPHCITNHPKTQQFKRTVIIYFSHESAIWAGPRGEDSSLLFAVASAGSCRMHSVLPHLQGQQADSGRQMNYQPGEWTSDFRFSS